jgi:uncharacterized surface protein with fasciclin (FAS1) repeats
MLPLVALTLAACGGGTVTTTETTPAPATTEAMTESTEAMGDVLEVAEAEDDLSTFLAAIDAGGMMENLHGEGPFTLFAPTDEAFVAYFENSGMSQEEALAGGEMLSALLGYHVVEAEDDSAMVMDMAGESLTTASGEPLAIMADGDAIMVGNATVERYDLHASNGVIHVIDAVLVPPSMAG